MKTTFQKIKDYGACKDGWHRLIDYYHPSSLDQEIGFKDIIKSNGIQGALWALRVIEDKKSVVRFCIDVAESVLYIYEKQYPEDKSVRECITACKQYVDGMITRKELIAKKEAVNNINAVTYAVYAAYDAVTWGVTWSANADAGAAIADAAASAAASAVRATKAKQEKWNEIIEIFLKYF